MENFYTETKTLRAYDVDINNKIKINVIFNILQDVAAQDAERYGFGYSAFMESNFAWLLQWVKLEIIDYPSLGDEIVVKTWAKCKYKLYSMRDFLIYNSSGKIICKSTSGWIPVNRNTKRIVDIKDLPSEIKYNKDHSALDDYPSKLNGIGNKEILFIRKIRYTDIDLNQHVNNTKYIEMMLDAFSLNEYKNAEIGTLTVSFLSESFINDEIEISVYNQTEHENTRIIEGNNKQTSKPAFISKIEWQSLKMK